MRGVLTRRGHEGWRNVWVLTCMGSNMYGKVVRLEAGVLTWESARGLKRWLGIPVDGPQCSLLLQIERRSSPSI